ncbi:MAG: hypothetical protein JSV71_02845, partial [Nitrospiraceae bacterium]
MRIIWLNSARVIFVSGPAAAERAMSLFGSLKFMGFIGTGLKKDEFVCECSDIDDIIVIRKDGGYLITKVAEKVFVGNDILYAQVFLKSDER